MLQPPAHHDEKELADAIRCGATRRPEQAFGEYYHGPRASCALGAAFEGLDERGARGWVDRLARAFELTLLVEAGHTEALERLQRRPLGLIPGARMA